VARRQWLDRKDVESVMSQAACSERRDHRLFIDKCTTRRVNEDEGLRRGNLALSSSADGRRGFTVIARVLEKRIAELVRTLNTWFLERLLSARRPAVAATTVVPPEGSGSVA
jgi:hypothetical protein